jgi:hypothetical protein
MHIHSCLVTELCIKTDFRGWAIQGREKGCWWGSLEQLPVRPDRRRDHCFSGRETVLPHSPLHLNLFVL